MKLRENFEAIEWRPGERSVGYIKRLCEAYDAMRINDLENPLGETRIGSRHGEAGESLRDTQNRELCFEHGWKL